jgi:DMSO/TMAO reductase YedYZ molybdopterin-dependent catalytic subunit
LTDELTEDQFKRLSRRSFMLFGAAALAGVGGVAWLKHQSTEDDIVKPLRKFERVDERLAEGLFSQRLAPVYPRSKAVEMRINGDQGLGDDFDLDSWRLKLGGKHELTLDELQTLQRTELTTDLRCVEGWNVPATWAGVRLVDLLAKYPIDQAHAYAALVTPDSKYYVGVDTPSALHPQTILAWELNGQPLEQEHGAPLRLVIPVKYGFKWLKRIGSLSFTDERPKDYWAERGYDYYAGL